MTTPRARVTVWRYCAAALVLLSWTSQAIPQPATVRFDNATDAAGLHTGLAEEWGMIAVADYDGDGWDDVYIGHHGMFGMGDVMGSHTWPRGGQLFRNTRQGGFEEQTELLPLVTEETEHRHQVVWCDIDRDGDEDLIIGTGFDDSRDAVGNRDLWLRNDGNRFTEIAQALGVEDRLSKVFAITCFDLDANGWPDVLTLQAPQASIGRGQLHHLWMNYGGRFVEEANRRGLVMPANQAKTPYAIDCADFNRTGYPSCIGTGNNYSYWLLNIGRAFRWLTGVYEPIADLSPYLHDGAWADFNGDGLLDAAVVDTFNNRGNSIVKVHCNNGSQSVAINHADGLRLCWTSSVAFGVNFASAASEPGSLAVGDFDNDGSPDLFVTRDRGLVTSGRAAKGPDYLFMNNGAAQLSEMAQAAGVAGPVGARVGGGGVAVIDYDRDGRLDLIVGYNAMHHPGPFRLYRNVTTNNYKWVGFILRAPQPLGAWISIEACGRRRDHQLSARTGWLAQDSRNVHFGLGDCSGPVSVTVRWPGGRQAEAAVAAGAYHIITTTGFAPVTPPTSPPVPAPTSPPMHPGPGGR